MSYESTRNAEPRERTPGRLWWVVVGLGLQALFFGASAVTLFLDAQSKVSHGQDGAEPLVATGVLILGLAAVLVGAAVLIPRRVSWLRWTAFGVECFLALIGLLATFGALVGGDPVAVALTLGFLLLACALGVFLLTKSAGAWFVS